MAFNKEMIPLLNGAIRLIVYGLLVLLLAEFMRWDAGQAVGDAKFSEFSYVEYFQSLLLLLSCVCLIWVFYKHQPYRFIALLMFGFLGASFIREQDVYFETFIGNGVWQFPVYVLLAFVLYQVGKNFSAFLQEIKGYTSSASFGLFLMGLLTTFVFSRLFGRQIFWYEVMEDRYIRAVKNAAEECVELYGYMVILFAVVELWIMAKRKSLGGGF